VAAFTGPACTFRAGAWEGFDAATDGGGFVRKEANGDNGGGDTAAGAGYRSGVAAGEDFRATAPIAAAFFSRCR
jgi:hypothetical protein